MKELIFASHNRHKCDEIRAMLAGVVTVRDLSEMGLDEEIPETGVTFEENALQKARWVHERTGVDCFADDSGLMVDALGGEPGVWSARYAGEPVDMERNMDLLLERLEGKGDRSARFVTVVAAIVGGEVHYFRGEVRGRIIEERRGEGGFGYDPLFVPEGCGETFAEIGAEEKNAMSHRAKAIGAMRDFLTQEWER